MQTPDERTKRDEELMDLLRATTPPEEIPGLVQKRLERLSWPAGAVAKVTHSEKDQTGQTVTGVHYIIRDDSSYTHAEREELAAIKAEMEAVAAKGKKKSRKKVTV